MTLEFACYLFFIQNVRLTKDFFDHYLVSVMGFLLIPLDGVIWGLKPIEKMYQKLSDRDSFPVEKANWGKQERRECYYYLRLHNCPPPEAQRCRAENEVRRPVPRCCLSPPSSWMTHCSLLPFLLYFPGPRTEIMSSGEATYTGVKPPSRMMTVLGLSAWSENAARQKSQPEGSVPDPAMLHTQRVTTVNFLWPRPLLHETDANI